MICKIWPINVTKISGNAATDIGVKNAYSYILDSEKVSVDRNHTESMSILDRKFFADIGPDGILNLLDSDNCTRALSYMANGDKIDGKYITGYMCNPKTAIAEFALCRNTTRLICGKVDKPLSGALAYHLVQSFPEGTDISDEEVHQCGIELCQKLNIYQAVICSHVHPVTDEAGKIRGKCKHNHILLNAYIHPSKLDQDNLNIMKYNDCKKTYHQLRVWNDEIAIEHGLPIISEPDNNRQYSWDEHRHAEENTSWKQPLRANIMNARNACTCWEDFVDYLAECGYSIREGVHTTYITPDGKRIRDDKLGIIYQKQNLCAFWENQKHLYNNCKKPPSTKLYRAISTSADPLYAALPVNGAVKYIPLCSTPYSELSLSTYFTDPQLYDICDSNHNQIFTASANEILLCLNLFRFGKHDSWSYQDYWDNLRKQNEAKHRRYYMSSYTNSRTGKPYRTSLYDENGRRRTLLELLIYAAIVVLRSEAGLWDDDWIPSNPESNVFYAPRDWRLQNMIDTIKIAREENIDTPNQLSTRISEVGARISRAKKASESAGQALKNMTCLKESIIKFKAAQTAGGHHSAETLCKYLQQHGLSTTDEMDAFLGRYNTIIADYQLFQSNLKSAKEEYRRLKNLEYNLLLAQNRQYCYGIKYLENLQCNASLDEIIHATEQKHTVEPKRKTPDFTAER